LAVVRFREHVLRPDPVPEKSVLRVVFRAAREGIPATDTLSIDGHPARWHHCDGAGLPAAGRVVRNDDDSAWLEVAAPPESRQTTRAPVYSSGGGGGGGGD